jgi:hopene-associated glycosyltransferase HpnB
MILGGVALLALAIWLYLICARGAFWLGVFDDVRTPAAMRSAPSVTAVIPARNEAECVGASIGSVLAQDYAGELAVVLVDDDSSDGTADVARAAAATQPRAAGRLTVATGDPLPPGWTGKMWALKCGIAVAQSAPQPPKYLLLTDADIAHAPDTVASLVTRAEAGGYVLTSLMAKLRCESFAERVHVPAFIYFFAMLYPFAWVDRPDNATAAAAGGCMLVRADALRAAGGIACIRAALIDDCALAAEMKRQGPIWLGLTQRVRSIRPYPRFGDFKRMVARSAYAQLNYSPLLLIGTVLAMTLVYLAPPGLALAATGLPRLLGIAAWALIALSFQPTLRLYGLSSLWGIALPAIAFLYMLYTVMSAIDYAAGRGGTWKGRVQANATGR